MSAPTSTALMVTVRESGDFVVGSGVGVVVGRVVRLVVAVVAGAGFSVAYRSIV